MIENINTDVRYYDDCREDRAKKIDLLFNKWTTKTSDKEKSYDIRAKGVLRSGEEVIVYKMFIPGKKRMFFFSDKPSRNCHIVYVNGKISYKKVEECAECFNPLSIEEALLLGAIRYYITLISDSPDFIFDIALRAARSEEDRMYKHHKKDEIING